MPERSAAVPILIQAFTTFGSNRQGGDDVVVEALMDWLCRVHKGELTLVVRHGADVASFTLNLGSIDNNGQSMVKIVKEK